MPNNYFKFKYFTIHQERTSFKVGTDGVILGAAADISGAERILDIGTGTGLVALMLAQRCNAEITAIEPDHDSFFQAVENVRLSSWHSRIKVVNCCLQDYKPAGTKFDLIVSNPPYFIDSLKNPDASKANTRHNALLTQEDILESMAGLLSEKGKLQVIMPYTEGTIFIASAPDYGLYCNDILKIKPLPSSKVKRLVLLFSRERKPACEKFLVIEKGARHDFTDDYKNLTRDFYMKF